MVRGYRPGHENLVYNMSFRTPAPHGFSPPIIHNGTIPHLFYQDRWFILKWPLRIDNLIFLVVPFYHSFGNPFLSLRFPYGIVIII